MKQKADHHLEFLADKNHRAVNSLLPGLPVIHDPARPIAASGSGHLTAQPSPLRAASHLYGGGEEDAAGESEDADGEELTGDRSFRTDDKQTKKGIVDT